MLEKYLFYFNLIFINKKKEKEKEQNTEIIKMGIHTLSKRREKKIQKCLRNIDELFYMHLYTFE